jgi:MATE family multidrug resistance protein
MTDSSPTTNDPSGASAPPRDAANPWLVELRHTLRLAGPIVFAYLGMMALGVVDTIMIGQYGAEALAAVAVGHSLVSLLTFSGASVLLGLDPLLGQALGAGDETAFRRTVQRGFVLAALLSVPIMAASLVAGPLMRLLEQPDELVPEIARYVGILAPAMPPMLLFGLLRQTLQALHRTRPIVFVIVLANGVNVAANAILIHGAELPFGVTVPPLGVTGSALATLIARWVMGLGLLVLAWPALRDCLVPFDPACLRPRPLRRAFLLGLPAGAQHALEIGAFNAVQLSMGWISIAAVGGHQITLQIAAVTFMLPLGVSAAAAIRVGVAVGKEDREAVGRAILVPMALGVGVMALCAVLFLVLPGTLTGLFTSDVEVLALAAGTLLPIAAAFQVFDGLQVVAIGVLRGLGDTRSPLVANIAGFWLLGIPIGLLLAFPLAFGPGGMWLGMVVGLGFVGIALSIRIAWTLRQPLRRLSVEDDVLTPVGALVPGDQPASGPLPPSDRGSPATG